MKHSSTENSLTEEQKIQENIPRIIKWIRSGVNAIESVFDMSHRLLATLTGALLGIIATIFIATALFDRFELFPLMHLWWKLSPGAIVGAIIGYKFRDWVTLIFD